MRPTATDWSGIWSAAIPETVPAFISEKNRKWVAWITFKGKAYYLGSYIKIEDAIKARKRGEEMHDDFLEWYHSTYDQSAEKEKVKLV